MRPSPPGFCAGFAAPPPPPDFAGSLDGDAPPPSAARSISGLSSRAVTRKGVRSGSIVACPVTVVLPTAAFRFLMSQPSLPGPETCAATL